MGEADALEQARDPRTPSDRLARLASHEDDAVRFAVAANPSTSRTTVEALLHTPGVQFSSELIDAMLSNPSLSLWLLEDPAWLRHLDDIQTLTVLESTALPAVVWEALRAHPEGWVRAGLLDAAGAPPEAWRRLGFATELDAFLGVLGAGRERLVPGKPARSQLKIERFLAHPGVPERLRADPSWLRRHTTEASTLAGAPGLTLSLWEALHQHESLRIRLLLLRSPVAPPDAWTRLSLHTESDWVLWSRMDDEDLEYLARSPFVTAATRLDLSNNTLEDSSLLALIRSPNFPRLTVLDLSDNAMNTETVCELAGSTSFPELIDLNLGRGVVASEGMRALARSSNFPHLTHLRLSLCFLGDEDVIELARTSTFRLTLLDLSDNTMPSSGHLAAVGDAAALAIAQSASLAGLTHLDLSWNEIGDEGALALTRAAFFPHLTELRLIECPLSPEGREALQEAAARVPGLTLVLDRP